jgi:non-heme chloroperoxidase
VRTPDGAELAVLVAGGAGDQGDPGRRGRPLVVLAHCWTGDRRIWGPVAHRLVDAGHRVVLYDQRGHRTSTVGRDGYTLDALADDLGAVLDAVGAGGARGAVVAGHSMGGMAAQALACRDPQALARRVSAMVLVATACDGLSQGRVVDGATVALIGSGVAAAACALPSAAPWFVRFTVGRTAVRAHLDAVSRTFSSCPADTRSQLLVSMRRMDLSDRLPSVAVPTVVVCGDRDRLTPPGRSRRIAALLPDARLEVLPGSGHMLPIEAPDRLTDLILDAAAAARADAA